MPAAVIAFAFDPSLRIGDTAVRWETVGIAFAIFSALVLAGVAARAAGLRVDDLLFVVLGVVPGAVIGGRIGYVLLHPAFFAESPGRLIDPAVGSLELTLAVVGGALTGGLVGALLDGNPGRWLHLAAAPLLVLVGAGKLAMVLGGSGQGQPTPGEPATAYIGPGPWGSLGPAIPSVPSQAIEGIGALMLLLAMLGVLLAPALRRPDGRAFLVALAGWCALRFLVAATWRDAVVAGPFRAEQVIAIVVALGALGACLGLVVRGRRAGGRSTVDRAPART